MGLFRRPLLGSSTALVGRRRSCGCTHKTKAGSRQASFSQPPAASVLTTINANATPTFGIFGTASGAIAFLPATNRIFVQFRDANGVVRGATSVAVQTQ